MMKGRREKIKVVEPTVILESLAKVFLTICLRL